MRARATRRETTDDGDLGQAEAHDPPATAPVPAQRRHRQGELGALYFQAYRHAYELAKQAERCYRFEHGLTDSAIIQFGAWDSLRDRRATWLGNDLLVEGVVETDVHGNH